MTTRFGQVQLVLKSSNSGSVLTNATTMKHFFLISLFLGLFLPAFGQFESMPSPTNQHLRDILFINPSLAVAVGDSGVIIRTTNGGKIWNLVLEAEQESFVKVAFFNQADGIAIGSNIFLTSDGGDTWINQDLPGSFVDVEILTNSVCLVSSPVTGLWRSTDKGNTWEVLLDEKTGAGMSHMSFVNSEIGFAIQEEQGGGTMSTMHTSNGGVTWDTIEAQSGQDITVLEALEFVSPNVGFRAGWYLGHLTRTSDAAVNWNPVTYTDPGIQGQWYDVHPVSADIAYVCGWYGSIAKTTDGGDTWFPLESEASSTTSLYGIHFIHQYLGCAVGYGGTIVCTSNGGGTVHTKDLEEAFNIGIRSNPASNSVFLIPEGEVTIQDVSVYTESGIPVMKLGKSDPFDVSLLSSGWYLLDINTSRGRVTEKLLIQR